MDDENLFRLMEEEEHMAVSSLFLITTSMFAKVLFYEEKKRESMKALQHMEMIDDEADMFGIRRVSQSQSRKQFLQDLSGLLTPPWPRIIPCGLYQLLRFSGIVNIICSY